MPKDYYKTLGIEKNASTEDIKKAFRALAHKYHPDKQGGDEAKFKEINEAYQVLSDEQKRSQYDQFGSGAFDGSGGFGGFSGGAGPGSAWDFSGFGGGQGGFSSAGFEDLGDLFGGIFGGGGSSRTRARKGTDIQVDVELSFKDSVFGVEKELSVTKHSTCDRCGGNGAEPGKGMKTCTDCHGNGVKIGVQRTILGNIQTKQTCATCSGTGQIPNTPCTTCKGEGIERKKKTLTVHIPAGVEDQNVLRVKGEGEAIKGGASGDLFVRIHVKPDHRFEREGSTIYSEKKIGFTQAALGCTVDIETVDGNVELKIPEATQSLTEFRLRGKGVQTSHDRGDQIVVVKVVTPHKLSREQRKALEELNLKE